MGNQVFKKSFALNKQSSLVGTKNNAETELEILLCKECASLNRIEMKTERNVSVDSTLYISYSKATTVLNMHDQQIENDEIDVERIFSFDYSVVRNDVDKLTYDIRALDQFDAHKNQQNKCVSELQSVPSNRVHGSIGDKFIQEVDTVIELNIENPDFTVETFALALHMSESSLLRKLKGVTGQSPNQYIRSIRLKIAAQLLKQGDLNVNEVCYKVGFGDVKYFRQCFQKQFGFNPSKMMSDSTSIGVLEKGVVRSSITRDIGANIDISQLTEGTYILIVK